MNFSARVACPYCQAKEGHPCKTTRGESPRNPHRSRFEAVSRAMRSREFVARMKDDDPHVGLSAGDELLCSNYPLDAKWTVHERLGDPAFEPCNVYISQAEWVRWSA